MSPAPRKYTATHWGVYHAEPSMGGVRLSVADGDPDPPEIADPLTGSGPTTVRIRRPAVRLAYLKRGPRRHDNNRGGEPFVEVEWDEALDLAAGALTRVRRDHGNEAIYAGSYGWASAGRFHHAQSQIHRFLRCFGGYTDSVDSYSFAAAEVLLPRVLGQSADEHFASLPSWRDLAEHTELVIAFGGLPLRNTQVNSGGIGRHQAREGQKACRAAGVEFVSVTPIRDDSEEFLRPRWIAPRPGTDVAILLAFCQTILADGSEDGAFLERCCVGFQVLRRYLSGETDGIVKDAEWAAGIAQIPAGTIRDLAREIAHKRTFITVAWALQRAHHGEQPIWAALALAAISGQIGRLGGGFGVGFSIEQIGSVPGRPPVAALPQPVNPVSIRIPVARVADLLLSPGSRIDYNGTKVEFPMIELVYWCGGNPFHHHQDLNRLRRAWQEPSTVIVHEPYWNAIAKHADIVLPVTTTLERADFAAGTRDPQLTAMHQVLEPFEAARDDYEIFSALAGRLHIEQEFTEGRSGRQWLEHLYQRTREHMRRDGVALPEFEQFWEQGYALLPVPVRDHEWPLAGFRRDPGSQPLATPSGRIELASETIAKFAYHDCPGHPSWLEPAEWLGSEAAQRFPLHMVSNQPRVRLHSQHDQGASSQATKIAGREPVRIHPADAATRGIAPGDVVRIFNGRGSCLAGAVLSSDLLRGVVQLATGAWYDPIDPTATDSLDRHGNPNVLTLDIGTSRLAQGPSAQTVLVDVERYDHPIPMVRAFEPPKLEVRHP